MATVTIGNLSLAFLPRKLGNSRRFFFKINTTPILKRPLAAKIGASSTTFVETKPTDPNAVETEEKIITGKNILACPICYEPLTMIGDGSSLQCNSCKKTYYGNETHLELTASSGAEAYGEAMPPVTEFFRSPLISFLYERGWRQNFIWGGFPGKEKEFEMTKDFLKPVLGGNIVDASCGSGLFSRLFAKSGLFSLVVALDYSENMLKQCYDFIKQEDNFPKEDVILVRADISRLPFKSSSVDAVHAGAALQCWPSPSAAVSTSLNLVAEISRVLRPGGVFVATTFILDGPFAFVPFVRNLRQSYATLSGGHLFLSEGELEDLCRACGLVGFKCIRNRRFVMISATKSS
ncbi:Methyltransf_11 domain-containing protein [Cephalotus follicularis]|uniref:Methyltransf_11 domain-containing protein n=1 Tax=Cephalotus follicularis TaxID=3775 RepID=A0A1Q3AUN3_CEPFO|nr:Methyltransf_11 domain-containing protein [Cephalotus follicularis]